MTTSARARTATTAQRALRSLLVAPLLVVMAATLSGCGKSAQETALDNCLSGMQEYVQNHPDQFTTIEDLTDVADLCYDMAENDPDKLLEFFG